MLKEHTEWYVIIQDVLNSDTKGFELVSIRNPLFALMNYSTVITYPINKYHIIHSPVPWANDVVAYKLEMINNTACFYTSPVHLYKKNS